METLNFEKSLEEMKHPTLKLFLSYSWKDSNTATKIEEILSELNIEFFRDKKDINWGENIEKEVGDGLSQCSHLLVVISPATKKSWWVPFEMGRAVERGATILPYLTDKKIETPSYISKLNSISGTAKLKDALIQIKQKHKEASDTFTGRALGIAIISGCASRYNEAKSYDEKIEAIEYCISLLPGLGNKLNMSEKLLRFYIEVCFRYGRLLNDSEAIQAFGELADEIKSREDEELNHDLSQWVLSFIK